MAEKKILFWIKPKSAPLIDGKPWDVSKPLPLDKLNEAFLDRNLMLGFIGEKLTAANMISGDADAEIKRLQEKIKLLESENKELKARNSDLEAIQKPKENAGGKK